MSYLVVKVICQLLIFINPVLGQGLGHGELFLCFFFFFFFEILIEEEEGLFHHQFYSHSHPVLVDCNVKSTVRRGTEIYATTICLIELHDSRDRCLAVLYLGVC